MSGIFHSGWNARERNGTAGATRRGADVGHLAVGMERREMKRHVGTEVAADPRAFGFDFSVGVVLAWNEKRRDLGPDAGLLHEVLERVEHRLQETRSSTS